MMTTKSANGSGRSRGRPSKPPGEKYIAISVKLPPDVLKWIAANATNRNGFIVAAVKAAIEAVEAREG